MRLLISNRSELESLPPPSSSSRPPPVTLIGAWRVKLLLLKLSLVYSAAFSSLVASLPMAATFAAPRFKFGGRPSLACPRPAFSILRSLYHSILLADGLTEPAESGLSELAASVTAPPSMRTAWFREHERRSTPTCRQHFLPRYPGRRRASRRSTVWLLVLAPEPALAADAHVHAGLLTATTDLAAVAVVSTDTATAAEPSLWSPSIAPLKYRSAANTSSSPSAYVRLRLAVLRGGSVRAWWASTASPVTPSREETVTWPKGNRGDRQFLVH